MEDVVKSQQEDIKKSTEFLNGIADQIEDFKKNMPTQFWQLSTEKFDGSKLYQDLTVALGEILRLERAAKGEIELIKETPTGFSKDSK